MAVVDDQDAAAEVETEPAAVAEADAVDEVEDEVTDKMAQPALEDHQGIVGLIATTPIIAPSATTRRKAIWIPPPSSTCSATTSTNALGSDIWGHHQLASSHLN